MKKALIALVLLLTVYLVSASAEDAEILGQPFPDFTVTDTQGNPFFSAGEAERTLAFFLGDSYTESAVLTEIPQDMTTAAFPVSQVTSIRVENENIQPVIFWAEGDPEPQMTYVIYDDTAHLRLEAAASDDPADMICADYRMNFYPLSSLLHPQREVFLLDVKMPDAEAERHYDYICLVDGSSEEGKILYGVYLISGDEYIRELENDLLAWGYKVTWEYAESLPAEETALQSYILHITDQNGAPVPGAMVNFCTDTACVLLQADENGVISFDGAPDAYHVQLLKVPDGYSFDADFEMTIGDAYSEWVLRIRKD